MGNALLWDLKRRIEQLEASGVRKVVRAATDDPLDTCTYALGVLTADADGALEVDTLTMAAGERVLVKDEADGENNGIYLVLDPGGVAAPWIMRRADDAFRGDQFVDGLTVAVGEGDVNAGVRFMLTNNEPIDFETDELTFVSLSETALGASIAATTNGDGASLVGVEDDADYFTGADAEAVLAELGAVRLYKRTATIGHADLTDADNGDPQTLPVGAALPTGAFVVACQAHLATPFSGGTPVSLLLEVGGTDPDGLLDNIDALGSAGYYSTVGVKPTGSYSGQQIAAVFTIDGANNLAALDAGSVTIDLWYVV